MHHRYLSYWHLYQDGTIEFELKLSGGCGPSCSAHRAQQSKHRHSRPIACFLLTFLMVLQSDEQVLG